MKGSSGNPAGRPKGTPNRMTQTAKAAFKFAFNSIGGELELAEWAREHRTEFYKLFSRLLPSGSSILDDIRDESERIEGITITIVDSATGKKRAASEFL